MEGWVDLDGWLYNEMVYLPVAQAVTHRSTNLARRRVTSLIESNALVLSHATQKMVFCFVTWRQRTTTTYDDDAQKRTMKTEWRRLKVRSHNAR